MALYEKINPNDIFYESKGSNPLSLNELILEDTGKTVSIMGPSKKGKAFYPQGFDTYSGSNGQTFAEVIGEVHDHYKEYQGRINSIYSSYASLSAGAQLNYTRLLGIDHESFGQNIKPGFEIGASGSLTGKLYVFEAEFHKKGNKDLTRFNFNFLENNNTLVAGSNNDIYNLKIGFLITKEGVSFNTGSNYNDYEIIPDNYDNTYKNLYSLKIENIQNGIETVIPQNEDLVLDIIEISGKVPKKIYFNFNKNSDYYFEKVLNKNPLRINEFGYVLYSYENINDVFSYCIENNETNLNNTLKYHLEDPDVFISGNFNFGQEFRLYKDLKQPYSNAESPWFVSQGFYKKDELYKRNNLKNRIIKLFKVHSLSEGKSGNDIFVKIIPQSLGNESQWASFDLHVFSKKDKSGIPLESFVNIDLNENSENYILRKIGDFQSYFDFNGSERITNKGTYNLNSKYIYIEISKDVEYQNIPKETIPCGFLENKKYASFGSKNAQSAHNYVNSTIFKSENSNSKISDYHSWGHNLLNLCSDSEFTNYILENKTLITGSNFSTLYITEDIKFNVLKIDNISMYKEETERYLNSSYYYGSDLDNNLIDNEIFHLEKIILFNSKKDNILRQHWELATYDAKGELLQNLNSNLKYYEEISSTINQSNHPFYYYQISKEQNFINDNKLIDSIEALGQKRHYISFLANLSGGFDGLNLFDIEQISMSNKAITNVPYIKELCKYGFQVMCENTFSDFIHLPGIYEKDILEKIESRLDVLDFRRKPIFIIDKPLYDFNNQIVEPHEILKRSIETEGINPRWSDCVLKYNQDKNVDIQKSLTKWKEYSINNSYISSFANYFKVSIYNGGNLKFDNRKEYDIILPSSILAMYIILNNNFNLNLTDIEASISKIGENNIEQLISIFKESDPKFEFNKKLIIDNNVNTVLSSLNSPNLKFYTAKTNAFVDTSNNQSLNSVLQIRIILNQIKRIIENAGNRLLFENVKSKKETLSRHNSVYTNIMNRLVDAGTIADYTIKLDEYSTSEEDLINNTIRGEIYIVFNGQNNYIKNNQSQVISIKI